MINLIIMPNGQGASAPEIPGYYFDAEKNRYFRIPPFPQASGVSFTPKKRKRYQKSFSRVAKQRKPKSTKNKLSIIGLLADRSVGETIKEKFQFTAEKLQIKSSFGSKQIMIGPSRCIIDLTPNLSHTGFWSTASAFHNNEEYVGFYSEQSFSQTQLVSSSKFTQLDPFKIKENDFAICSDVGKSTVYVIKENVLFAFIRRLKNGTPFACAGAKNPLRNVELSYSDGSKVIFVHSTNDHFSTEPNSPRLPSGGRGSSIVRLHKDILTQCFGWGSSLHFNGLRGGDIIGLDPRQHKSYACQMRLREKINVSQIVCLKDDRSLIAAHRNPQSNPSIYLWDFRFPSKPVMEYISDYNVDGIRDRFAKYRLRINIDFKEKVLCSALPDMKVRLWDIKTGEQFFKYPYEGNVKVTVAAYSSQWDSGIRLESSKSCPYECGLYMGTIDKGVYWKGH